MKVGWKAKSLGDLCNVIGGGTPQKDKAEYYSGDIPWATVRDMRSELITKTEFRITPSAVKSSSTNIIPGGNVVIATRVGLGKVCLLGQDTAINQDLRGIVPIDQKVLEVRFLFWWLKNISDVIVAEGTGATVQGVKLPFVKGLQLPLPPLPEQQRIVTLLDEAFDGIATARAHAEKNLQNARAIFLSQREVILSSKPGWHEAPLTELCDVKHGYAFEGAFFAPKGNYVLLTPGSFFEAGGYRERSEKTKFFVGQIPDDYILEEGSLLVAMTEQAAGLLGSPLLVPESNRFLHNQRLGLVTAKPGVPWLNAFFFHAFNLGRVRQEIHASASGVKVRHTSPGRIGAVRVAYPISVEEQRRVAEQLCELSDECERLESLYQRKLIALDDLKKSLLHQAFSGQLTSAKQTSVPQQAAIQTTTPEFTANVISFAYAQHERKKREKTFGHVKEQKMLHLVESIAGIDLGRLPMRNAAGPNDFAHMLEAEKWAKAHGFFEMAKRDGGYEFKKLRAFDEHMSRAHQVLAPYLPQLESVIDLLLPMDTDEAEVFTTVHAAWNNLLIDGMEVTDDAIVLAARDDWHTDKLKIPEHKFRTAIALIRQKNLVPDGTAKYVGDQHRLI